MLVSAQDKTWQYDYQNIKTSGGMALECTRVNWRLTETKNSWKTPGATWSAMTYISTKLRSALLRSTLVHCCNMRHLRQTEWCSPPGSHRHWLQVNSYAHNSVKLNYSVNVMILLQPLRWHWLCDSPRTRCERRTTIYTCGANK